MNATDRVSALPQATLGRAFEGAVADWLISQGYTLIARNYTVKGGEIDLVMDQGGKTVFIEVKARIEGDNLRRFGRPAAAVDSVKQDRLIHAAERFLKEHPERRSPRLDVVEVYYTCWADFYCLRFCHIHSAFGRRQKY